MSAPFPASLERFPTLRQSRLSTFDKCALQAHFEEEYRHDWSGHPQARGQILHRVLARAMRTMYEQQSRSIETDVILELLFDTLAQGDIDQECPSCGAEIVERHGGRVKCARGHDHRSSFVNIPFSEIKDLRWEVVKFAKLTEDQPILIENLVDIEHRLRGELAYTGTDGEPIRRVLTGQLDVLFLAGEEEDEAVVIDYKSTWDLPAPSEVGFEGYFQQRFYAWLVMVNYPAIQSVTTREHYTRFSATREATVTRNELEYIEAELAALAYRFDKAFGEDDFPPSPGRHCQLCPRPAACPIFPGVRQEGMITDDDMARRIAGEALVAKAAYEQRQKALKAWTSVRGPITINSTPGRERVLGFREGRRTSRPTKDELERQLYLHGSRIDLDALYKEQVVTRFEPHYPRPVEDSADDAKLMQALEASIQQHEDAA
jgi:hypothetical protein